MTRVEHIGRATLSGIYAITNRVNGKQYVGSAVSFKKRWAQHRCDLRANRHKSPKLQAAWNKHGADAFDFSILEAVEEKAELLAREQRWLDTLRPYERGYNHLPIAGSRLGTKHSNETRAKLRLAQARRGPRQPCSEETKRKLSLATKGRKRRDYGPEYSALMSSIMRGRPGRQQSQETRDKLADIQRGKRASPETRAKITAAQRARRERERANA